MSSQSPANNQPLTFSLDPELSIPLIMNNLANFALEKLNLQALCSSLPEDTFLELKETVRKFFLNDISISDFQSQMYQAKQHKQLMKKVMECALKEKEMILSLIEVAEKKASEPQSDIQKDEVKQDNHSKQSNQVYSEKQHGNVKITQQFVKSGQLDKKKQVVGLVFAKKSQGRKEAKGVGIRLAPEPFQQQPLKKAYILGDSPSVVFHQQSQPSCQAVADQLDKLKHKKDQLGKDSTNANGNRVLQPQTKKTATSSKGEKSQVKQSSSCEEKKEQESLVVGKQLEKKKPEITEEQSSSKLQSNEEGAKLERNQEKQSIVSSQVANKKIKCKFYPQCKNKECKFFHPTLKCEHFPKCKFGNSCIYIHPSCKFGSRCTRRDCFYTHPKSNFHSKSKHHQVQLIPKALRGIIDDLATEKRKALLKSKQDKQTKP